MTMNQKLLTGGIALALIVFLAANWMMQKKVDDIAQKQSVDRSLTLSEDALDSLSFGGEQEQPDATNSILETLETSQPSITLDGEKTKPMPETAQAYTATLHTEKGDIVIALQSDGKTPKTVQNFVTLAKKDFYTNTVFHRTIKGFMIQGGDPKGDGTGGPGYTFDDEPFEGEYTRGTVAMANAGPNTNGSQFFILHADYALPKNYVIFGKVTKGMDVVDQIATAPTTFSPPGESSKPVNPVVVKSVTISE